MNHFIFPFEYLKPPDTVLRTDPKITSPVQPLIEMISSL